MHHLKKKSSKRIKISERYSFLNCIIFLEGIEVVKKPGLLFLIFNPPSESLRLFPLGDNSGELRWREGSRYFKMYNAIANETCSIRSWEGQNFIIFGRKWIFRSFMVCLLVTKNTIINSEGSVKRWVNNFFLKNHSKFKRSITI